MIRRIPDLTTGLAFPSMSEIVADSVNEIMTNISEIMSCYMEQVCVVSRGYRQITWLSEIGTNSSSVVLFTSDDTLQIYDTVHINMQQSVRRPCAG